MKKSDKGLIAALLLIAAILYGVMHYWPREDQGLMVQVHWNKKLYGQWPLNGEEPVEVTMDSGNGHNLVVIEDGQVRMVESNCPDQICIQTGTISRQGQSLVCLPNRIIVQIVGSGKVEVDDISQ